MRKPPHAYFGWAEGNPLKYLARFIFFGEGDIAPTTREILRKAEPDPAKSPATRRSCAGSWWRRARAGQPHDVGCSERSPPRRRVRAPTAANARVARRPSVRCDGSVPATPGSTGACSTRSVAMATAAPWPPPTRWSSFHLGPVRGATPPAQRPPRRRDHSPRRSGGPERTVGVLQRVLPALRRRGYQVVTVSELAAAGQMPGVEKAPERHGPHPKRG